ncbi:hypothetical protein AAV98_02925 [Bacillus sp. CHD6a]|nr:hypothetical protein AAV98_02925 [Bacillus sp. CHD6a]
MIKIFEFKKLISSPIIWTLLLLFMAFNVFIIFQHSSMSEDMKRIQPIIEKYGTLMDEENRKAMKQDYEVELAEWNKLITRHGEEPFEKARNIYSSERFSIAESNLFTMEELESIKQLAELESYLVSAEEIDQEYNEMDMEKVGEEQIKIFGLTGLAADKVTRDYKVLSERVVKLVENKEHLHLFFSGKDYTTHTILFQELFLPISFQLTILTVLITAFIVNYEFEQQTALIMYSAKRGRKLIWDKLIVALGMTFLTFTLLMTVTLGIYFWVFDYSGLWNVQISSGFLTENNNVPFISWGKITFVKFLAIASSLLLILQILFCLLGFCLSVWIKNTYMAFTVFAIIFGVGLMLPNMMPRDGMVIFYTHYTPFILLMGLKKTFMASSPFTMTPYFEVVTLILWFSCLCFLAWLCIRQFKHQNI